jgi:pilus assembly protein CpaC
MFPLNQPPRRPAVAARAILILLMALCLAGIPGAAAVQAQVIGKLNVTAGKSVIIKSPAAVKRVSIADPAIADFVLTSPREIYITGRVAGVTNMIIWQDNDQHAIYDLEVAYDISRLKQQLHEVLPDEQDLRVTAMHDTITLSGRVSNLPNHSHALTLARAYAPEGKVHDLVEVRGVQQVMLEVRVAEMQRSLVRRMGVNFNYLTQSGKFGISQLGNLTELVSLDDANISSPGFVHFPPSGPELIAPFGTLVSPNVNALLRFSSGGTTWTGFIDALKSDGLVKVLAEPTLIALSGETAFFNAGGEFPVPVPQGLGTVAIEYRKFGVSLKFTPTVLADNKINIRVAPEVSELDFSSAVQFGGFVIPGLSSRNAETVVELADGQSFAIAGLLRDTVRDASSKFPFLGDIPILGVLFRSKSFQKNETELIIIATPRLVKPLDTATQPLPTDFYIEPTDTEFYVLGLMQGQEGEQPQRIRGELDGEFGHAMPQQ